VRDRLAGALLAPFFFPPDDVAVEAVVADGVTRYRMVKSEIIESVIQSFSERDPRMATTTFRVSGSTRIAYGVWHTCSLVQSA
jgi:hypothetical protein